MHLHWMRFDVNFFDDARIKVIEKKTNGEKYLVIWIKLLCLAMRSNRPGFIELMDGIPYDIDDLASALGVDKDVLSSAIKIFFHLKMIEVADGKPLEIIDFRKAQDFDWIDKRRESNRIRQERKREKDRNLLEDSSSRVTVRDSRVGNGPKDMTVHDMTEKDNTEKEKKTTTPTASICLPHSSAFQSVWMEWLTYRKERKIKTTMSTINRQLKLCASLSEKDSVSMIEKSITNGWQGLFPPEEKKFNKSQPKSRLLDPGKMKWNADGTSEYVE